MWFTWLGLVTAWPSTLDLVTFQMARLKRQVEEIDKKLSTPLQLAIDFFGKTMCHMDNKNISGTIKEMEFVKRQAMKAFQYALSMQ